MKGSQRGVMRKKTVLRRKGREKPPELWCRGKPEKEPLKIPYHEPQEHHHHHRGPFKLLQEGERPAEGFRDAAKDSQHLFGPRF